eukprot:TRINITY_DN6024_c0_g1_i1.p1 TRINITY_DN6024_c0_g1~~TRINITY_DN6024_c0_g1_i1.p1  ORF type:complete len:141 (+),score=19.15 TRINITY_DN6024_c0_g1_i1:54-425(+)
MAAASSSSRTRPATIAWCSRLVITLVRGLPGKRESHRRVVRALGLRKVNHSVEKPNDPSILGMIDKVKRLLMVETKEMYDARMAALEEKRALRPPLVVYHQHQRPHHTPSAAASVAPPPHAPL